MNKVLNFDKFISEKKKETIAVTVMGKEYTVSQEIPAIVPVMMGRAEGEDNKQLATKMVMRAADAMFGEKNVNQMCADGLGANDLATLVQRLFQMIQGTDAEEDDTEELSDDDSRVQTGEGKKAKK